MNEMVIRGVRPGTKDISLTFIILDVARPTVNIFYLESCDNQNPLCFRISNLNKNYVQRNNFKKQQQHNGLMYLFLLDRNGKVVVQLF
jgi:hypothetical protein